MLFGAPCEKGVGAFVDIGGKAAAGGMALFPDDNSFCEKGVGALFVIRGKAADTVLVFDCFSSPSDTLGSGFNAPVRAVAAFSGVVPKGAAKGSNNNVT